LGEQRNEVVDVRNWSFLTNTGVKLIQRSIDVPSRAIRNCPSIKLIQQSSRVGNKAFNKGFAGRVR